MIFESLVWFFGCLNVEYEKFLIGFLVVLPPPSCAGQVGRGGGGGNGVLDGVVHGGGDDAEFIPH